MSDIVIRHYPNGLSVGGWQLLYRRPGWYYWSGHSARVGPFDTREAATKSALRDAISEEVFRYKMQPPGSPLMQQTENEMIDRITARVQKHLEQTEES